MKKLIIYAAGAGSREILLCVKQMNQRAPTWDVLGFTDDNPALVGKTIDGIPVLPMNHNERGDDLFAVCGVLNPVVRKRIIEDSIEGQGLQLATIIHHSVELPDDLEIAPGSVIMPHALLGFNVKIGKGCFIWWRTIIGHDLKLGDYSNILSGASITGGCTIGSLTTVGAGAILNVKVAIGYNCKVGIGTTVLTSLANNSTIMALPRTILTEEKKG